MRVILVILISFSVSYVSAQSERKYIRKGNNSYEKESYVDAEVDYRKALDEKPDSRKAEYNLANSLYKQEKYEAAGTKYATLGESGKDKGELSRYYYNLGNSLFKENKFEQSIEAYKNALINNPGDFDAKHNLVLAQQMLQQQQKEQQQQQQEQEQQKDQQQQQEQQQQEQQQEQQKDQQQQQQQQQEEQQAQISKEDAERLLQALEREEKDVMKKLQEEKAKAQKVRVDKDW